jgi:hypothetical protein
MLAQKESGIITAVNWMPKNYKTEIAIQMTQIYQYQPNTQTE